MNRNDIDRLWLFTAGELDESECGQIESELRLNAELRDELAEIRTLHRNIARLEVPAPAQDLLEPALTRTAEAHVFFGRRWAVIAGLASAALIIAAALILPRPTKDMQAKTGENTLRDNGSSPLLAPGIIDSKRYDRSDIAQRLSRIGSEVSRLRSNFEELPATKEKGGQTNLGNSGSEGKAV